jgi:ATP-dependent RNA helicase DDX3X
MSGSGEDTFSGTDSFAIAADSSGGAATSGDIPAFDDAAPAPNPVDEAVAAGFREKRLKEIEENRQKAKEAGWCEQTAYTYPEAGGEQAAGTDDTDADLPKWLSDAAVYEWDDEYGEVGPVNPELERELFHSGHLMRAGGAIKALKFDVNVVLPGKVKVSPVMNVSASPLKF